MPDHPNHSESPQTLQDPHLIDFPSSLEGVTCYSDASLSPDTMPNNNRNAGLGVLIVNRQYILPRQSISLFVSLVYCG
jgi:hypothetical protein